MWMEYLDTLTYHSWYRLPRFFHYLFFHLLRTRRSMFNVVLFFCYTHADCLSLQHVSILTSFPTSNQCLGRFWAKLFEIQVFLSLNWLQVDIFWFLLMNWDLFCRFNCALSLQPAGSPCPQVSKAQTQLLLLTNNVKFGSSLGCCLFIWIENEECKQLLFSLFLFCRKLFGHDQAQPCCPLTGPLIILTSAEKLNLRCIL